jgi:hypothetical protein
MLKLKKITVFLIIFIAVIFLLPNLSLAQNANNLGVNDLANSGLGTNDLRDIITNLVNVVLGVLGILVVLIIFYGGWIWMTSQGDAEKIDKAKKILVNAVIGLVIILSSYAIARFIIFQIYGSTGGNGNGNGNGGGYHGGIGIGGGVIENHYPARNAVDVPRNTNIYITFKEPINRDDVLVSGGCDFDFCAHPDNIILVDTSNDVPFDNSKLRATLSEDNKILGLNPYDTDASFHLGSVNGQTSYNFAFSNEIEKENGDLAFGLNGYDWDFSVSNQIDVTPPTISSVVPVASSVNPRNTVVQINFSESVNPLFASGQYDNSAPDFTNITVKQGSDTINGQYLISNQYQTVEFLTDNLCGTNSCGGNVYCLEANADFVALVTDNIKDMADNALDGDNDDTAGGDYSWSFSTNNTIDLIAPQISQMQDNNAIDLEAPIQTSFNKNLLASSINSENISFVRLPNTAINYWLGVSGGRDLKIYHDKLEPLTQYQPTLGSDIQDTLQNCFKPCTCNDPSGSSCVCNDPECAGSNCVGN